MTHYYTSPGTAWCRVGRSNSDCNLYRLLTAQM